jgi:hypothetical protein
LILCLTQVGQNCVSTRTAVYADRKEVRETAGDRVWDIPKLAWSVPHPQQGKATQNKKGDKEVNQKGQQCTMGKRDVVTTKEGQSTRGT